MKLKDWLQLRKMKQVDFAKLAKLSPPVVNRIVHQDHPDVEAKTIRAIFDATGGEVTANDILGIGRPRVSVLAIEATQ